MYEQLAIFALFVFVYSLVAGRIEDSYVSGPMIFMAFGLIVGPFGLGLISPEIDAEGLRTLAEITLALVLFTDASKANLRVLKESLRLPIRLLLIGLPLTILFGFGVGVLLFQEIGILEIAILATMLAPTDAALGKAVVSNESVPPDVRVGLNVESGLNDGICVPILLVFLALATGSGGDESTLHLITTLVLEEIGIGFGVGIGVTFIGLLLLRHCASHEWIAETWSQLPVIGLAMSCFSLAQILGGSGFIAAFVGGILFGGLTNSEKTAKESLLRAAEGVGDTLALATWVLFGVVVVAEAMSALSWQTALYGALSLTVIRMLPVYLCLCGTEQDRSEKLFIGWFGPRGLASIVFAVIVLHEELPHGETLAITVVCTVVMSIIAHGITANPLVRTLGELEDPSTK